MKKNFPEQADPPARHATVLLLIAILLVGANMRISVYSIGPLLDMISIEESVGRAALGGLVSIPLAAWGIVSAFTHSLGARFGVYPTVLWSLVVLACGTVLRSLPGSIANIWIGTAIIGAALAIGNVLIPAVIRRDFTRHISVLMALYTGIMAAVGAVSSGLMIPIADLQVGGEALGWRVALLMTGVLLAPAIVMWIVAHRAAARGTGARGTAARAVDAPRPEPSAQPPRSTPLEGRSVGSLIWRDRIAWLAALYMGTQSASFYILSTWIPTISVSHGRGALVAGFDVMGFQITSIVGSLMLAVLFRGQLQRWLPALIPLAMILTSLGIIFMGNTTAVVAVVAGVLAGLSLSMGLTLPLIKTRDVAGASALSGMAQSIGYSIAALGPVSFGALYDFSGSWVLPAILLVLLGLVQTWAGFVIGNPRRMALSRDAA